MPFSRTRVPSSIFSLRCTASPDCGTIFSQSSRISRLTLAVCALRLVDRLPLLGGLGNARESFIAALLPALLHLIETRFQLAQLRRFLPLRILRRSASRARPARRARAPASFAAGASLPCRLCRFAISVESSISCVLSEARARFMMSSGMPSRAAISSPADFPGKPTCS